MAIGRPHKQAQKQPPNLIKRNPKDPTKIPVAPQSRIRFFTRSMEAPWRPHGTSADRPQGHLSEMGQSTEERTFVVRRMSQCFCVWVVVLFFEFVFCALLFCTHEFEHVVSPAVCWMFHPGPASWPPPWVFCTVDEAC